MLSFAQVQMRQRIVSSSRARVRRNRKQPRPRIPPHNAFRLEIIELIREARKLIELELFPRLRPIADEARRQNPSVKTDAVDEDIETAIENTRLLVGRRFTTERLREIVTRHARNIDSFNLAEQSRQFKAVLGIDLPASLSVAPHIRNFVRENVSLIKSIPDKLLTEVEGVISRGVRQGVRHETMIEEITARFGVTENRARTIARDQVGKLNGELASMRQQEVGVKRFIWRTSRDERVRGNPSGKYPNARPSHWAREGKTYEYGNLPDGVQMPGVEINCRCRGEPVLEDVLSELGI